MLYGNLTSFYLQTEQCRTYFNLDDVFIQTISVSEKQSMNTSEIQLNSESIHNEHRLTAKEKRAEYMSKLRGPIDSEYRRIERENNAKAMRRKRLENPLYREHERRQNRAHMAEIRRDNVEYRQREHLKNRHRMALKRNLIEKNPSKIDRHSTETTMATGTDQLLNSIYQTLESNLQAAHISFIPYQNSSSLPSTVDSNGKRRTEFDLLKQVDDYCRQRETTLSLESFSLSAGSSSSSSC